MERMRLMDDETIQRKIKILTKIKSNREISLTLKKSSILSIGFSCGRSTAWISGEDGDAKAILEFTLNRLAEQEDRLHDEYYYSEAETDSKGSDLGLYTSDGYLEQEYTEKRKKELDGDGPMVGAMQAQHSHKGAGNA